MATIPADVIRIQEDTVQQVKDHPLKLGQLGFAKVDRIIVYRIKDGSGYIEFPDSLALQAVVDQVNELEEAGWETVYEETVPSSLNGISFLETEAGVYTGTADIRITALSGGVVQGSIKYSIIIESNVAEAISYTVNGFEQNIGSPSTIYYDPVDDKVKICFIAITTATMKVEISSSTGLNAVTSDNSGSAIALLAWDISKNESFNNTLYYPTLTGATTSEDGLASYNQSFGQGSAGDKFIPNAGAVALYASIKATVWQSFISVQTVKTFSTTGDVANRRSVEVTVTSQRGTSIQLNKQFVGSTWGGIRRFDVIGGVGHASLEPTLTWIDNTTFSITLNVYDAVASAVEITVKPLGTTRSITIDS